MVESHDQDIYYRKVRENFIEEIKNQILMEEKARQYSFILRFAEKIQTCGPEALSDFLNIEKKSAEKEKLNIDKQIEQIKKNVISVYERKCFIPMLELETCILTTHKLPDILYFLHVRFRPAKPISENLDEKMLESVEDLFTIPFDYVYDQLKINITHAHIALLYLSINETIETWEAFFNLFVANYNEHISERLRYLYFFTIWFEFRPKHFLSMTPYIFSIVEQADDGDLLIKHLKTIFDIALARNIKFKYLPLDSVPFTHHVKYAQYSNYHKKIEPTDPVNMINTFKSNHLRRFDLATYNFADQQTNHPNSDDFLQAFAIAIATFLNSLSLDILLYQPDKTPIQMSRSYLDKRKQMQSTDIANTHHLCDLFTTDVFEQVKTIVSKLEYSNSHIERMRNCLYGFSLWVAEIINENNLGTVAKNIETIHNSVAAASKECAKFIKVNPRFLTPNLQKQFDLKLVDEDSIEIPECFLTETQKTIRTKFLKPIPSQQGDSKAFFFKAFDKSRPANPEKEFFKMSSEEQKQKKYSDWVLYTQAIIDILNNKPQLNGINMNGYDLDAILKSDCNVNFNELLKKRQQFVDPWAIRIIFYNLTKHIFDNKNQEEKSQ